MHQALTRLSSSSERSLVSPVLVGASEVIVQDELGQVNQVAIDEYARSGSAGDGYALVNLENSAVNIENSSDVVIGPVTNFNVSGNVTIFQNGQRHEVSGEGDSTEREETPRTKSPKLSQLPSLSRKCWIISLSCLTTLTAAIIACAVVLTKNNQSNKALDPDYFGDYLGTHKIYYRETWGAKAPQSKIPLRKLPGLAIISHTATTFCKSLQECSYILQRLQEVHMSHNWNDIGYNFLIGGDGAIYVGRGWNTTNFLPRYSIAIAFVGNFCSDQLTDEMIDAALMLLDKALDMNELTVDYKIVGENQTRKSEPYSPGENVVKVIKRWTRYTNATFFKP